MIKKDISPFLFKIETRETSADTDFNNRDQYATKRTIVS